MYRNSEDTGKTTTATSSGGWAFTFGDQPTADSNGSAYAYTVKKDTTEINREAYTTSYTSKKYDSSCDQLKLTFNSSSATESSNCDYVRIYYKNSSGNVKATTRYGGNNIANVSIVIPKGEFWVYFRSDRSANDYGFEFASIDLTSGETLTNVSSGSLPKATATE